MMGDAIDYNEWKTGKREEGTVYALHSFFRKLAQGIGPAVAVAIMGTMGYVNNAIDPKTGAEYINIKLISWENTLQIRSLVAILYLVAGLFILMVYRSVMRQVSANRSFCITLMLVCSISAMVVLTITSNLALSLGMSPDIVVMVEIGDVIELGPDSLDVTGVVPSGSVLIDGLGIGDVGAVVLRDRKHLAEDGLLIVVMGLDHELGTVVSGPDIISRGFVYVRESDELVDGARAAAMRAIDAFGPIDSTDWNRLKNDVREWVQRYIYDTIKRNPMILPIIVEI
jgi:hypothetical protein